MAIIGVVAALTIPSVIVNYQKNVYVTQLKKTYNYLSNGFKTMMARDGVTQLSDTNLWAKMPSGGLTYENFLADGSKEAREEFLKVFSTAQIYDNSTLPDNLRIRYKGLNCGSCTSSPIESNMLLSDGASVHVTLYKTPASLTILCGSSLCKTLKEFQTYRQTPTKFWQMAGDITIDVNGYKGPNQWGRDMFRFVIGNDGVLYSNQGIDYVSMNQCNYNNLSSCSYYWKNSTSADYNCSTTTNSKGNGCAARIMEEGWKMNY